MLFRRKGAAEPRLEANEHRPKTPPAVSARAWRTPNTLYTCPWWTTPARHPLESRPRQPRQPHVRKLCEKYGLVDFQTVFATQSSRRQIHADKVQPALSPGTWIPTRARAKRHPATPRGPSGPRFSEDAKRPPPGRSDPDEA